jgi:hypothetical protein
MAGVGGRWTEVPAEGSAAKSAYADWQCLARACSFRRRCGLDPAAFGGEDGRVDAIARAELPEDLLDPTTNSRR